MNNIYEEITALASGNQASSVNQIEERDRFVDKFLTDYLNPEKVREKDSLREKIKFKHHQLETASKQIRKELKAKESENKKNQSRKKPIINCQMKKSLGLFKLDLKSKLNFTEYEKMNELWKQYAYSSLMTCLPEQVNPSFALSEESVLNCLKQLDYHGCILTVTKSKVKNHIGLSGIVLQEKKNSFFMLTKENSIKLIPKQGTLFEFELFQAIKFTLVGSNMCCKPELRSTKHAKIKTKNVK
jgi:ribonuclease P protein subunit POP4